MTAAATKSILGLSTVESRETTPNESDFTTYVKLQKPEKVAIADARVVDVVGITS